MPIQSIITQPGFDAYLVAYRPIVFEVAAKRTDGTAVPPVVYCDIYKNGIFYRTISKTQPKSIDVTFSRWEFDIQDSCQEFLGKYLADNGTSNIVNASDLIAYVSCRFRSTGYDANGFLVAEGTAPVQGTDDTPPQPGSGFLSNSVYVINATLQHEDHPDFVNHIALLRRRLWDDNTFPLTHRPDRYFICKNDSDSYPLLSYIEPAQITLFYQVKGSNVWQNTSYSLPCDPAGLLGVVFPLPDGAVGVPYSASFSVQGTQPFTLSNVVKPAWMTISLSGSNLLLSGIPQAGDEGTNINVSLTINNCTANHLNLADTIDVTNCQIVELVTTPLVVPDAAVNQPYDLLIPLKGTPAYLINISTLVKPAWATVQITGSSLEIIGTPPTGGDQHFFIDITNCGGTLTLEFDLHIPTGPATYGDPVNYTIQVINKVLDCTLIIKLDRNAGATTDSSTDNKNVRVNFHAIADNGCAVDNFKVMLAGDNSETFNQDVLCGRGPCGSFANVFITSIDIL